MVAVAAIRVIIHVLMISVVMPVKEANVGSSGGVKCTHGDGGRYSDCVLLVDVVYAQSIQNEDLLFGSQQWRPN